MSNQHTQDKHTLAQVLGKINALSQKKTVIPSSIEPPPAETLQPKAAIPVLTEVYQGDILHGRQTSDDAESSDGVTPENLHSFASDKQDHEKIIKKIMVEMQPMIDSAIKEALIHELAVAEVKLLSTLERDLNAVLRLRLESILKS